MGIRLIRLIYAPLCYNVLDMPDVFVSKEDQAKEQKAMAPDTAAQSTGDKERDLKSERPPFPFRSYFYKPCRVRFDGQQKDEEILLLLRRHLITNIPWIIIAILLILAPLVLPYFPIISFLPPNFQTVAVILWYLVTFAFILESFLIWFFNVSIVTTQRVVDIDFLNLLYKEVSDLELNRIEDVTYKMGGGIRTIFNYGDVFIQTASEIPNFEFLAIPKPDEVVELLHKLAGHRR